MKFKHLLACMAFIATGLMASVSYAEGIVTGITAPGSAVVNTPVSVTVTGNGFCDSYTINWGDTHSNMISGPATLPHTPPSHTYTSTGTKTISIASHPGCIGGTVSTTIQIKSKFSTISSISGSATALWESPYKIKVMGDGRCKLLVKWGDGKSTVYSNYNLSAPTDLFHRYKFKIYPIRPYKRFTIKVKPAFTPYRSFCRGSASKSVRVGVSGVVPKPAIKIVPGVRRFK